MNKKISVLIVEDSEDDALLVIRQFKKADYDTISKRVETAYQMQTALGDGSWDLVISDYNLPEFDAPSALRVLQKSGLDIPFIVVSGAIGEDTAVVMMKAGANDYIMKGNLARLVPAVEREISDTQTRRAKQQADKEIKQAAEEWIKTFDSISDLISIQDMDYRLVKVNQAYARAVNMSPYALVSQRCYEVLHGTACPSAECPHGKMFSTQGPVTREIFEPNLGVYLEVTISPIFDADGTIKGSVHVAKDVTDRKQAEEHLRESEEKFRSIYENSIDAIFLALLDGTILAANPAACRMFGRSEEEIHQVGRDSIVDYSDNRFFEATEEWKQTGTYFEKEYTHIRKDGTRFPTEVSSSFFLDKDGQEKAIVTIHDITERKKAEQRLIESEEIMRYIVKYDTSAIAVFDLNLNYMAVSNRYLHDFSVKETDIIGKYHYDIFPEISQKLKGVHSRCLAGAVEREEDDYFEYPDGSFVCSRWECRPWYRSDNTIGGIITYSEVTTERVMAEKALRLSEERMRLTLEAVNDGVWDWNIVTGNVFFSPRCYTMLGYKYNEFPQDFQLWQALIDPNDVDRVIDGVGEHLKSGKQYAVETQMRSKTGGWQWIGIKGMVVERDDNRRATRMVGTHSDITERKKAETKLLESEERYRTAIEYSNDGIGLVKEGKHIYVNKKLLEMFGYEKPEDLVGKPITVIVHPDHHEELYKELYDDNVKQQERSAMPEQFEFKGIKKDGKEIFIDASVTKTVYHGEQVLFVFSRDITSRKKAEEELAETTEKLRKSLAGTLQAMAHTVEIRDPYTAGHEKRVSALARSIAQEMGLSKEDINTVRMAGSIHDIGKMSVPAEILSKPTRLSELEMGLIKIHSQAGYDILKDSQLPYPVAEIILQHHERLDGSGYPQGLKDDQILIEAQIIAVADTVEAMASHRPYRPALGIDVALEEIEKNKGILYNAAAVEICLQLFRKKDFRFE